MSQALPQRAPRQPRIVERVVEVASVSAQNPPKPSRSSRRNKNRRQRQKMIRQNNRIMSNDRALGGQSFYDESILHKAKILKLLSRPEQCEVVRYNDGVAAKKTAIAKPFRRFEIDSATAPQEQPFFLFRSGPVNVISPITRTQNYTYQAYLTNIPGFGGTPSTSATFAFTTADLEHPLEPAYWKVATASASAPHGDYLLSGRSQTCDASRRFAWIDAGCNLVVTATSSAACTLTLLIDAVTSNKFRPNVQNFSQVLGAPGAVNLTIAVTSSGYYSVRLVSTAATTLTTTLMTINQGASTTVSRHICMKNYCDNISDWLNMRMISSSIRYCNTAPVLNLSGSVTLANVPAGQLWTGYQSFNTVSSLAGAYNEDVREGAFGRLAIVKNDDLTMRDWTGIDSNYELFDTFWDIEPPSPFIAMVVSISDAAGRVGFIEQWSAIEFETTKTQYDCEFPIDGTADDWAWAIQELKHMPQFTKNKIHLEEIGAAIKNSLRKIGSGLGSAANFVGKYAPKVIKAINTGQQVAEVLAAL